jgi:DNA-binding transcriptional ArsR family regulator
MNDKKAMKQRVYEGQAFILKALGQPNRLQIVDLLKDGERCVCEIFSPIHQEQANISKHLSILKQAGILESRKEGLHTFYRIKNQEVLLLLKGVTRMLKDQGREQKKMMAQL